MIVTILVILAIAIAIYFMFKGRQQVKLMLQSAPSAAKANEFMMRSGEDGKKRLLFVHAPWCGHCKQMKPIVRDIQKQCNESGNCEVMSINGHKHGEEISKYLPKPLEAFPTFVRCTDRGCDIKVGAMSTNELSEYMK